MTTTRTRMSAARARATRTTQLTADIAAAARCASPTTDPGKEWFRGDTEPGREWAARSRKLRAFCQGCPVLAQCREIGLREDTYRDPDHAPEMVRGGMTGQQLARMRRSDRHRASIDRALALDARHDERALHTTARRLARVALVSGGTARDQRTTDAQVRELADRLVVLRSARRASAGWGQAA